MSGYNIINYVKTTLLCRLKMFTRNRNRFKIDMSASFTQVVYLHCWYAIVETVYYIIWEVLLSVSCTVKSRVSNVTVSEPVSLILLHQTRTTRLNIERKTPIRAQPHTYWNRIILYNCSLVTQLLNCKMNKSYSRWNHSACGI